MSIEIKGVVNACKRRPVLCVCVFLALVLVAVAYFRKEAMADRQATLEERTKLLRKLSTNIKYADKLAQHTESLRQVNKVIADNSLKVGELALNQQIFLLLESETGVKLIDLRPLPVLPPAKGEAPDAYVPMGFALTISGQYRQLITFVKRLEQGPTLARIVSASIGESGDAVQNLSLNVELLARR